MGLQSHRKGRAKLKARSLWIDVSVPIRSGMVHWPGDPAVRTERIQDLDSGGKANVSTLSMSAHTGTHMDAPLHFLRHGRGLDEMPPDTTLGPARVIEIEDLQTITVAELRPHRIRSGERLLFKTRNSRDCWTTDAFVREYVHLSLEAAKFLAQRKIRLVGMDYLSVGKYQAAEGATVHKILLAADVWIIEGLNLSQVTPGTYELVCLPLRIQRSDGAPARALLRPLAPTGATQKRRHS